MKYGLLLFALQLALFGCTKRAEREPNPFPSGGKNNNPGDTAAAADPNSFKGIYARILKPTCANSPAGNTAASNTCKPMAPVHGPYGWHITPIRPATPGSWPCSSSRSPMAAGC